MTWDTIALNDASHIPSVAFGTWRRGNGEEAIDIINSAFSVGFTHIDTAQAYRNEAEAGAALRASGLKRKDVMTDIDASIRNSCEALGVDYVDLYLIHGPKHAKPDIPTIWKKGEAIKESGLAKYMCPAGFESIGVSNFTVDLLKILLEFATNKPYVNQIMVHPQVMHLQMPVIEFCRKEGIVVEGYSPCLPLIHYVDGPVTAIAQQIARRLVLLAWAKSKGVVVITSSTKLERLKDYISAGDFELYTDDVKAIDAAGMSDPKELPS
ncbi:NADP-dependent oxidoreductase domain-containing protein [Rhodofomes roseus]|uniref:NADP-dependent oxidoreductase domain-containing protein n=1 Tax=Rhodofomes roseus TaxID=34475 RepID=A0ABQ8KKA0_9APHY|nr:NADP-dependent oxidoreductase domain-containing protein [Rhodofomes roseus]KAH9838579.1 NADP-dependent oxidoreductase domain-containing protein [Rhodofomes roseus]